MVERGRVVTLKGAVLRHSLAFAVSAALMVPLALLTQHRWAPFDRVHSVTHTLDGATLTVTWDLEVARRYPASFSSRLVHSATGRLADVRETPPGTGKVGRFRLRQVRTLPPDAEAGEWCFIVIGHLWINRLNRQERSYPPVCFTVPSRPRAPPPATATGRGASAR